MVRSAAHSAEIAAARERCFAALLEYETFPEWQRAVKSVDVLARDEEGRGREGAVEDLRRRVERS